MNQVPPNYIENKGEIEEKIRERDNSRLGEKMMKMMKHSWERKMGETMMKMMKYSWERKMGETMMKIPYLIRSL